MSDLSRDLARSDSSKGFKLERMKGKSMKKKFKGLVALVCAVFATLAVAVPAYAAGPYTLTITSETPGHTYEAYQVFKGDVSADGETLSNVQWGDNVISTGEGNILEDLNASTAFGDPNPFASCESAADVAAVLQGKKSAFMDAFAEVAGANLTGAAISFGSETGAEGKYSYSAEVATAGYYLVQDASNSPTGGQYAKTKFILEVVHDVTAEAKADQPTLDKKIASVNGEAVNADYANAAVGDTVTFTLTSAVPEMDGYNKYFFVVTDTLSDGFTLAENFGTDDVAITVGDAPLAASDYAVSVNNNVITISINDLVGKSGVIAITYSATVDSDAVIGDAGNNNSAYLEFSKDPNYTYTDLSDVDAPMGKTLPTSTYTYVGGLIIHKVDEKNVPIAGAQFKITSSDFNQVVLVGTEFVQSEEGTYYELKSGAYTTVAPAEDNSSEYVDTETMYALQTTTSTVTPGTDGITSWVDASGNIIVAGLSEGTYTITELVAPDGYNKADPVTVEVGCTAPSATGSTACAWKKDGAAVTLESKNDMGLIPVTIQNLRGATLPSTGGMGKTVLIGVGVLVAVIASVGLVAKYRSENEA
mgnify:CR=1 FL=1